jgi:ribonuclease T2
MTLRMFTRFLTRLLAVILLAYAGSSLATIPLHGRLIAERDCPLYVSIKKGTNPDRARLVPGRSYPLIGKNKEEATHYRVRAESASPAERWVEVGCGQLAGDPGPGVRPVPAAGEDRGPEAVPRSESAAGEPRETKPVAADAPSPAGRFVLAASWLPAFCELRGRRPECRDRFAASRGDDSPAFSLHGLWPQPRENVFCRVPDRQRDLAERGPWSRLPVLDLGAATRARLEDIMPGTRSYLHRYQWTKHGSCYGMDEDAYYRHSVALMEQLNASGVRELFSRAIGRHLSARDIRGAFDRSFGRGAGDRVRIRCDDGMISELRIGLRGRVSESASLSQLIGAAGRRSPGCRGGRVDRPGLTD